MTVAIAMPVGTKKMTLRTMFTSLEFEKKFENTIVRESMPSEYSQKQRKRGPVALPSITSLISTIMQRVKARHGKINQSPC